MVLINASYTLPTRNPGEKNAEKRKIRKRWQMTPDPRIRTE